jgi:hypothetical protein
MERYKEGLDAIAAYIKSKGYGLPDRLGAQAQ